MPERYKVDRRVHQLVARRARRPAVVPQPRKPERVERERRRPVPCAVRVRRARRRSDERPARDARPVRERDILDCFPEQVHCGRANEHVVAEE